MDEMNFRFLVAKRGTINLEKARIRLKTYNGMPLTTLGKFSYSIETKLRMECVTFYVVKGSGRCLLSGDTAIKLGLIEVSLEQTEKCNTHLNEVERVSAKPGQSDFAQFFP